MTRGRFAPDWLALREPVDHRSRAQTLLPLLRTAWSANGWTRILDLGSGTGSNLRYLGPRLIGPQEWTLLDHDADLLAQANDVEQVRCLKRLHGNLEDDGLVAIRKADLVTCAAVLDLVPEKWLRQLVQSCRAVLCGVFIALTYDGVIRWSPDDPDDELVREAVNAHQRRDQGAVCALGPAASTLAETLFKAEGYRTLLLPSSWRLDVRDDELARALVDGWEHAAREFVGQSDRSDKISAWADRRRQATLGNFTLTVGHQDLLALPPNFDSTHGDNVSR